MGTSSVWHPALVQSADEARAAVEALLGTTFVVRTRAAALRLRAALPPHARLVTLRGEVFRGDGLITAGRAPASSILSRPRQRRELAQALTEMTGRLEQLESRISGQACQRGTLGVWSSIGMRPSTEESRSGIGGPASR